LGGTQSHWACYRFATRLREERERIAGCLDALAPREAHPDMGREVAIDASRAAALLDTVRERGFAETVAMDMGYDHRRVYDECPDRGCAAIIPLRKGAAEKPLRFPPR
jgi:hypothetical protein